MHNNTNISRFEVLSCGEPFNAVGKKPFGRKPREEHYIVNVTRTNGKTEMLTFTDRPSLIDFVNSVINRLLRVDS